MDQHKLSKKTCIPCSGKTPALKTEEVAKLHKQLSKEWHITKEHRLEREYSFPDFKTALAFTNKVGALAEKEGHHPDILLSWGKVKVMLWTHAINGLSESDFILAAKCDELW